MIFFESARFSLLFWLISTSKILSIDSRSEKKGKEVMA